MNEEIISQILELSKQGLSSRKIAKRVYGRESAKSSVNDVIGKYQGKVRKVHKKENLEPKPHDNSCILVISDMHIPYHHPDTFDFLEYLKRKYNPTRVICVGDELDKHSLSYHDSDPDLPSAGDELKRSLPFIHRLYGMFPKMDILESNHGSLVWRKAKTHGIPRHYIKSYQEVLGIGEGWNWYFDITVELPDGNLCYFHHGKTNDVLRLSQSMGMCAVQGHYHERFKIDYWGNPNGLYWGLQVGCLIHDDSYAFSYNNTNLKRPVIGTAVIVDGHPILEPMVLDKNGKWRNE